MTRKAMGVSNGDSNRGDWPSGNDDDDNDDCESLRYDRFLTDEIDICIN